jgi:HTH-type transcriptional regulator / antitoxin HipB
MTTPLSNIGDFVRSERAALGWTQRDVALYAGVSRKFVVDVEAGKPSLQMDSVNRVLALFGKRLGLVDMERQR